ncbi:Beta-galactosidase 8 [Camellia lanceoleosa]|uniref:Beta-galactosidase 8 n=1 Tax=Camellia lanceoleosa TaxID=1840588 RepID=A0ACC0GG42_9ERIC|nr:Beta-galactosidase 8 [Camellia lanceoleosa]
MDTVHTTGKQGKQKGPEEMKQKRSGFPLWLHFIPRIQFRTDNEPFKAEMKRFIAKIVDMMKQENSMHPKANPLSYPR